MFSQEKSQVEICLLKSNLEEIENELLVHRSAWPKFDAENENKFRETLSAVKASRALSVEIEKVNQENVRLVARRMHLKAQSKELADALEKARETCRDLDNASRAEKQQTEQIIRKYEDLLREQTAKFRETRAFFNESEMQQELAKTSACLAELLAGREHARGVRDARGAAAGGAGDEGELPDDLLHILGKTDLDEQVRSLTARADSLQLQLQRLTKQ